ncbi:hypothetical protein [Streptomyces sp900116325]|uniref:hypothetical protein n=1 Tax=Streptomyces sp. 900116325 TaxID=3154295 RepID=UPI0033F52C38
MSRATPRVQRMLPAGVHAVADELLDLARLAGASQVGYLLQRLDGVLLSELACCKKPTFCEGGTVELVREPCAFRQG